MYVAGLVCLQVCIFMCLNYMIVEPHYSGYHYYGILSEIVIAKVQHSLKLRLQCQKIAMVKAYNNGLEWKYWKFHLIFWCGNFVKRHGFCRVSDESPETLRKLSISTYYDYKFCRT